MKVKLVYGCPCSGKSTYVADHASDQDMIYDYDALLSATTTQKQHLTTRHAAHYVLLELRSAFVETASNESAIEVLWLQCRWPTDTIREMLDGIETEDIFIEATKAECYERLMADENRPDKDEWKAVIDAWFEEHGEPAGEEAKNHMSKFWKFVDKIITDEAGASKQDNVLRIDGPIDSESWWGDEVTPDAFREELEAHPGDIEVYINSPGGDVIAASQIYTMLVEHKGNVVVKIEGLAASAASIIAMAGTTVLMAPVAYMMIHSASTIAWGNQKDMRHEAEVLAEIDKGIRDAYCLKTGLRESKVAQMMEDETWMSAKTCISLGFADDYIGKTGQEDEPEDEQGEQEEAAVAERRNMPAVAWTGRQQFAALLKAAGIVNPADLIERMKGQKNDPAPTVTPAPAPAPDPIPTAGVDAKQFYDRLNAIKI